MFAWILSCFTRYFTPRRPARGIFHFWDGQRDRAVDPFEILRAIANDPECVPDREAALMLVGDDDATQKTIRCVRRVFGVKPFSEGGLLEDECLQLIEAFYDFLSALKKNTSGSPISSEPTAPESSPASTDPAPTPGNSSLDSPKTPNEAN